MRCSRRVALYSAAAGPCVMAQRAEAACFYEAEDEEP